jgi:hypothetical protein
MVRFREAGVRVAAFCGTERVSVASFYQWRKKLARSPVEASDADTGFIPVRLVTNSSIVVELRGGTRLQIPVGDPRIVQSTIQALVRADAERLGGDGC